MRRFTGKDDGQRGAANPPSISDEMGGSETDHFEESFRH